MDNSPAIADLELIALSAILSITDDFLRTNLCITKQDANKLARELSRFLAIKALDRDFNHQHLSPSILVDSAWKVLLNQPKKYYTLCMELCGEIIDHAPLGGHETAG